MTSAEPAGIAPRRAALRLLDAVLRKGLPLEAALNRATRDLKRADDRAFAHAIAAEALRRLTDLDALIDAATPKRLPDDVKARFALRIALVQALAMDVPHHAAIATALPLVDGGPRRLVHAVFSAVLRSHARLPEIPSLPPAVAARWQRVWGSDVVRAAAQALAAPPPVDLGFPSYSPPPQGIAGISLLPGHWRLSEPTPVVQLPGYAEGGWWVQDISASIAARLLGEGRGRDVLDTCAAPGGKTMQLAAQGFRVTAVDISESRLARLRENLRRTGLTAETIAADILHWRPAADMDAILLDAPCSATGIFRRHPDVLYRATGRIIASMAETQKAMLARVADWLKPGGTLVYSVCSLEAEEGEGVVDAFLQTRTDYQIDPIHVNEVAAGMMPDAQGRLRILPGALADEGGADSFFIARLRRN